VNINCRDYEKSKAFYEMLGFKEFWPVPATNTEEVANAVAMPVYKVKGSLMALENAEQRTVIDLLEWQSPRDESPPYQNLYRPGLARIALASADIDADYRYLVAQGVEVLSAPVNVTMSDTSYSRFFCFKDPDGTFLELVQVFTDT
jgi:catechol 2,3-dioxygenase-like lactoylglutathione lyase family enzyme